VNAQGGNSTTNDVSIAGRKHACERSERE